MKVKMFADDVKIYMKIVNDVDIMQLQHVMTSVTNWDREWQLTITIDKCCVLSVGKMSSHFLTFDNCTTGP